MGAQIPATRYCVETRPQAAEWQSLVSSPLDTSDPGTRASDYEAFRHLENLNCEKQQRMTLPDNLLTSKYIFCLNILCLVYNSVGCCYKLYGCNIITMNCIQQKDNERCSFYHDENVDKTKDSK